jgi:tRNA (guanosine-2'-O-)-methyltransferase
MTPERKERLTSVLRKRQPGLTVVMENVADPHNISAVMRTCDAVGIQDIYILNTRIPRHKKWGTKSSSSAEKWLTVHQFTDAAACFREVKSRFSKVYTTHLGAGSKDLYDLNLTETLAFVFGNEHSGVSEEVLPYADGNFIIPQMGIIKSLNISVACAVSLYEALRQKRLAGHYDSPQLSEGERNRLAGEWEIYEPI